jgi:hypothetical protein
MTLQELISVDVDKWVYLSGFILINGYVAVSYCVAIEEVQINPEHKWKRLDRGRHAVEFIDVSGNTSVNTKVRRGRFISSPR